MNNNNPYYGYPYYGYPQQQNQAAEQQPAEQPYKKQNTKTHFAMGVAAGAAAALLLSNENVRGKLMGLVSGAGDMLKSGGSSVKEGAVNTASAVKENVSTGSEIFKDTYAAGKQGFQESVERHKEEPAIKEVAEKAPREESEGEDGQPVIKEHE